jgi:hypothetical protein
MVIVLFAFGGLGPLVIIVPLICLCIVVVLGVFGIGGVNFMLSGDKFTLEGELEKVRNQFAPEIEPTPAKDILILQLSRKFRVRLADIAAGKGNTAQAAGELKELGISISDALKNPDAALASVLLGLSQMKSTVGKSVVATSLFGSVLSSKLMEEWNRTP